MSNTPFVKTIGRGSAATREASWLRGHSLSRKVGMALRIVACAAARTQAPRLDCVIRQPETNHDHAVRLFDLELLQQGQDGAARKGSAVRRGALQDRQQGRSGARRGAAG